MDNQIFIIISILMLGAVLGTAVAWLLLRTRAIAVSTAELATLKERLAGREQELQRQHDAFNREVAEHRKAREEYSQLRAELEGERRAAQERTESFRKVTEELGEKFKALSRDALKDNNQAFLDLARATLERFQATAKGDLESRQKAIDQLVKPLRESLEKVDGKIGEIEKERAGAYSELREQVKALATSQSQLQTETGNLVNALRAPHVRGRWGEIQLRRVVELAGMLEYCDFGEQETVTTEDGRIRPDLIVRLPGNRTIVVDAKVPFDAFYESISTSDDEIRRSKLKEHARLVR
ncbi:MAG: DNA recombination protein RmuC, partial [Pyrinomonadaceae bacterium]